MHVIDKHLAEVYAKAPGHRTTIVHGTAETARRRDRRRLDGRAQTTTPVRFR
jgi:hypothetical protein